VSAIRLPPGLLAKLKRQRKIHGWTPITALANVFHELRNQILLHGLPVSISARWANIAKIPLSPFDYHIVVALLADEGYQPYIANQPLPADVPPRARETAAKVLNLLAQRPEWEPAYQELASRTVVGTAANDVAQSLWNIETLPPAEQHEELAALLPFICSTWSLGVEVAEAEELHTRVAWRPLVFQGLYG
jgi:hypothetical protein